MRQRTAYRGIWYRELKKQKMSNGRTDRYYIIRYGYHGKIIEEGVGLASSGWTPQKIHEQILSVLKKNHRLGSGPQTLAEMRIENEQQRSTEKKKQLRQEMAWLTLNDFFEDFFLPSIKKTKRSWKHDAGRYEYRIRESLGMLPMRAVTPDQVADFLEELSESGLSPATILHYAAIIRRMFNVAKKTIVEGEAIIPGINPVEKVELPILHNARERFLTHEEAARLLDAARESGNHDLYDAIALTLETGLRLGELLRLEWSDINMFAKILTVKDEDHRKPGGKIPLSERAIALLRERMTHRNSKDTLVFQPVRGKERKFLAHEFSRLVDTVGLNAFVTNPKDKVVFHTLRHTFASWLAIKGTDIYRIKTLMRHKTLIMTMRYAHLSPDAGRDAVNNLWD